MIKTYKIDMIKTKSDINYDLERYEIKNEIIYAICKNPLKKFKNFKSPYDKDLIDEKNYKTIFFILDFDEIVNSKMSVFKNIKKIKLKVLSNSIYVNIQNYKSSNEQDVQDILQALKIQFLHSKVEKVTYIYDKTCEYLDNQFITKNLCQFENNKCIAKRDYDLECGCCRHAKDMSFFSLMTSELVECEYLNDKRCIADCITCKLYTCPFLNKLGIKIKIKDLFLINNYFNFVQKLIIKTSPFTPKEKILKKLV